MTASALNLLISCRRAMEHSQLHGGQTDWTHMIAAINDLIIASIGAPTSEAHGNHDLQAEAVKPGWREGIEAAAKVCDEYGSYTAGIIAAKIRSLPPPPEDGNPT